MLVILIIVGAMVAIYAVQWIIGATVSGADRVIRGKTLAAGRMEASTALAIQAPATPEATISKIVDTVNAYGSPPALVAGLFVVEQLPSSATFGFGSKAGGTFFTAIVELEPTMPGCSGRFEILNWTEAGADVAGKADMTRLRTRIRTAAEALGGTATDE